jgi:hypothetical protein
MSDTRETQGAVKIQGHLITLGVWGVFPLIKSAQMPDKRRDSNSEFH